MSTATLMHTTALSRLGHALSDGTRTRILLALRSGPVRPSELAQDLGVSKQVMSNQLACLRGCGLVTSTAEGRSTWYRLADPRLGDALGDLLELVITVDPNLLLSGRMHLRMTSISIGPPPLADARPAVLHRRVRVIVAATIAYNVVEAIVALTAGSIASSSALMGFGLDSIVEVLSAAAVAWQFASPDPHRREKVAMRVIAFSFFGLAAFVTVDALRALLGAAEPDHSPVGIVLAGVSLVIMPFLSWLERRTGRELGSASAVADSKQTLLCTYLSAVLLVGLLLNSTLGWSWADPIAALVIAAVAVREGFEAWRGEACCSPVSVLVGENEDGGKGCGSGCTCCSH